MNNKTNYKVLKCNEKSGYCLICFSSNGLRLENDYFEFENITKNNRIKRFYNKIIFIKDVKKHFYIEGINPTINSLQKLLDFLKKETNGLKIRTIGNSSGAFMAFLSAYNLENMEVCYSFSGVLAPLEWHGPNFDYNVSDYECLKNADEKTFSYLNTYTDLTSINFLLLHFASYTNKADQSQTAILKKYQNENVKITLMDTLTHGQTVWSYDFKYLLTCKVEKLIKLNKVKQPVSRLKFSLKNQGLFRFLGNYIAFLFRNKFKNKKKKI